MKPTTIDFETFGIDGRPDYPPIPVGVSIEKWGRKPKYYAFGHIVGNNCCWSEAVAAVEDAYKCKDGVLFQNGKFDVDVAEVWFGLKIPEWDKIHDTMFLLFLDDPHQKELGLKESAERLLGLPPEERDEVAEWLIENQPVPGIKITKSKSSDHYYGRYLCLAPGDLLGPYANGDVSRTSGIFKLLYPKTIDRGMLEAYDRERQLMPLLLDMERQGLPVNLKQLREDVENYSNWSTILDAWIINRLKAPADINLSSGKQLMDAMIAADKVDLELMPLTKTGKVQTNKEALLLGVKDKVLLGILKYRAQLNTCLNTFMIPWLKVAEKSKGLIYTNWNQVKSPKGKDNVGTRTGRLSSTPNFQNIPKTFGAIFKQDTSDRKLAKTLPSSPFKDLPRLPQIRSYVIPFKGDVFIDRDYSQQEPRILAHFDGGQIMDKYLEDNWIDFHDYAKEELELAGKFYDRRPVKNTNLGLIYGMGVGLLAERNNMAVDEAKALKKAILQLYPGIGDMYKDMRARAKSNQPIRTWGGREIYCEPPALVNGKIREFDYKMVNMLVQGSAADCTKEAVIRFYKVKKPTWKLVLQVHDQLTASVPRRELKQAMEVLRQTIESVEFDVPILSEGATSSTNWNELIDYDKKGVIL